MPLGRAMAAMKKLFPGMPPVKLDEVTGCCNNFIKFSYVVSAPLHMKGFFEFFGKSSGQACSWAWFLDLLNKLFVTLDLLGHLTLWCVALGLQVWLDGREDRGHAMLAELNEASFWALFVAFMGIIAAQLFAMFPGGQEVGKLFPLIHGAIVGGAYVSIIFSVLWMVMSTGWTALVAQYEDGGDGSDNLKSLRHAVMWTIALKTCAVATLKQNAIFWGPCTIDEAKQAAAKTAQYYEQNGMEYASA